MAELTVRTSLGALGGKLTTAVTGESARAFLNVPYCAPPLGSLRFREPQPPLPWDGTRDATAYGKEPVQGDEGRLPFQVPRGDERDEETGLPAYMGEDSLNLNIFTPVGGSGPLPVLFYIYGGGFNNGAGSLPMYDGTRLANRQGGAVVVTINYRLGALGFLYKPGGDVPANLGLLDMLAALRWVQNEVAAFGGDADRVTIFGESAGGMACGALLGSPLSKGLFSRAICISGSASAAQSETSAGEAAAALAVELGVPYEELSADALQAIPIETLRQAWQRAGRWSPVVAPPVFPNGISPIEGVRQGLAGNVAVMSGTNRDENNLFMARMTSTPSREELEERVAGMLSAGDHVFEGVPSLLAVEQARRVVAAVAANPKPWWSPQHGDTKGMFLQIMSDMSFNINHERTLDAHPGVGYAYRFDYESPIEEWSDGEPLPTPLGACHALGVMFMLGNHKANEYLAEFCGADATADQLSELMMDSWVAFAATGSPETEATGSWPLHDPLSRQVMVFGDGNVARTTLRQNPRADELAAWAGFRRLPSAARL